MSSTVSLSSAVLLCEIVEQVTLNDRSLAALEAGIESIALATIDKRVSERKLMRHQSRTLPLVSLSRVATFIYRYFVRNQLAVSDTTQHNATQHIERTLMHASVQSDTIIAFRIRTFRG